MSCGRRAGRGRPPRLEDALAHEPPEQTHPRRVLAQALHGLDALHLADLELFADFAQDLQDLNRTHGECASITERGIERGGE